MEYIEFFIDFVLHIDKHLAKIVAEYETWTYLILCLIVFCETGLVVTPFLPGDSLLFAAGAIAGLAMLNIYFLVLLLFFAAFTGDNINYFVGKYLGETVYQKNYRLIKREYLIKTSQFYEKHGGKTLVIARFMPILRTFAPFVAGVGKMMYPRFLTFSFLGNLLWVNIFLWAGYIIGNNEIVKKNFSLVIACIIIVSLIPPVVGFLKMKFAKKNV